MKSVLILFILLFSQYMIGAQPSSDQWLDSLLRKEASPLLKKILDQPDTFRYQLIYTRIDRDKINRPEFTHHYLQVDRSRYFNPASTVKMPLAFLALEKLNRLDISGLTRHTSMLTDTACSGQTAVQSDSSAANGMPSIAHYIRKIFLVSNNDAYNRLYEFIGQQTINERLDSMGYKETRITRRFVRMTEEENRHTNPIRFMNGEQLIYEQPATNSEWVFDFSRKQLIGNAHYDRDEKLVSSPMDFTTHNSFPLEDQQRILQSVIFPESVSPEERFNLTDDDYQFLLRQMSMLPSESTYPAYDSTEFFDSYTKFFFFRADKGSIPPHLRSFNKTGWSYGFLTDVCYIVDFKNGVEFMLSGNIYVNSDGVLNDDKYEYEEIGYPFFREVGKIIYQYELKREREFKPNLDKFRMNYRVLD